MKNKNAGYMLGIFIAFFLISTPVYGKEFELKGKGSVITINKQIRNMEEDYKYLEKEISNLLKGKTTDKKRKEQIKSVGNFQFQNGEVCITASDFVYLADEIDEMESTYKCNLVDALNCIGTYFKADGSAIYDSNLNEIISENAKTDLSFEDIKQGILNSQSVKFLSQTQATDQEGKKLYYADEEGMIQRNLYKLTVADTGYPVLYQAAVANNLSAGTVAWVNGNLIKGNGVDNAAYREQGYKEGYEEGKSVGNEEGYAKGYEEGKSVGNEEGYAKGNEEGYTKGYEEGKSVGNEEGYGKGYEEGKNKGNEEGYTKGYEEGKSVGNEEGYTKGYENGKSVGNEEGYTNGYEEGKSKGNEEGYTNGYNQGTVDALAKVRIQYTYHVHEGNDTVIGGCYGNCVGYRPVQCNCYGWVSGSYGCDNCHHAVGMHGNGYCTGIVSNEPYTYIGPVCGKTTETIEGATIVY